MSEILRIENVCKVYKTGKSEEVWALKDINLNVNKGERLAIVGESGCGKTTLARLLTCLELPSRGRIVFEGQDIGGLKKESLREFRKKVQMIFQDPSGVFSPRMKIGYFLMEPWVNFEKVPRSEAKKYAIELLESIALDETYFKKYPHELSGGELQRVCIARALALEPSLLICDEATSALDVSIQKKVLNILTKYQEKAGFCNILITHDLALAEHFCDRVVIMKDGEIVEIIEGKSLKSSAKEPYTRRLLESVDSLK